MKASQIILEEFKSVSLLYEDIIENCEKIDNHVLDIFASFKRLAQAYKDALFMEGEIERKGGVMESAQGILERRECKHEGHMVHDHLIGKSVFDCKLCGYTKTEGPKMTADYTDFMTSCKLCDGSLIKTGHTLLSDPPQYKYICRECKDVTYKQV